MTHPHTRNTLHTSALYQIEGAGTEEEIPIVLLPNVMILHLQGAQYWDIHQIKEVQKTDKNLVLRYAHNEVLTLTNTKALHKYCYKHYSHLKVFSPTWYWLHQYKMLWYVFLCVGLLVCALCFVWHTSTFDVTQIISYKQEKEIGKIFFDETLEKYQKKDSASFYLYEFAHILLPSNQYAPLRVAVVHANEANAFALPGGYIVVYDSLLRCLTSYEELVSLLGHEWTHIHQRHSLRILLRQYSMRWLWNFLLGDKVALNTLFSELGSLQYSRTLEKEADLGALEILSQQHLSAKHFISLLHTLDKIQVTQTPSFVSSHPDTESRMREIQKRSPSKDTREAAHPDLALLFQKLKKTKS